MPCSAVKFMLDLRFSVRKWAVSLCLVSLRIRVIPVTLRQGCAVRRPNALLAWTVGTNALTPQHRPNLTGGEL
jgi:hypothetical protein